MQAGSDQLFATASGAFQQVHHLPHQAGRLMVDQDEIGVIRLVGCQDQPAPIVDNLVERHADRARRVAALLILSDRRDLDDVTIGRQWKLGGARRPGQDHGRSAFETIQQRLGNREVAAEVAEPVGVVAVKQKSVSARVAGLLRG